VHTDSGEGGILVEPDVTDDNSAFGRTYTAVMILRTNSQFCL
jgi:hypothetical protein